MSTPAIATIDIGTNTTLLLVARPAEDGSEPEPAEKGGRRGRKEKQ